MSIRLKRSAGVLMPVFSLPSEYGIGAFSKEAYDFVDKLCIAKQHYWQILPLNPTSYGDSPYQSFSTFAGNPYFIDLEQLKDLEMITDNELASIDFGANEAKIDYEKIKVGKEKALKICFKNAFDEKDKKYQQFLRKNEFWLDNYSLYMALKEHFNNAQWTQWDVDIKLRKKAAVDYYKDRLANEINYHKFVQFLFFTQWNKLKKYANSKKVKIIGDIPIYVAFDSADVWENPELFKLDKNLNPLLIAGCPPDEFSKKGQLWGNPVYNWKYHKKTGFEWWIKRIEFMFKSCDVLRIDHFRGFDSFYAVKHGSSDATEGKWYKGPGNAIFEELKQKMGNLSIIAEDLGFITDSVVKLLNKTGFYGMKVFQLGFEKGKITNHAPNMYKNNCVAYTGTHDNNTIIGWYNKLKKRDKENVEEFLFKDDLNISIIKNVLFSVADVAIIPMPDYLAKSDEGRINTPSTVGGNWEWRMNKSEFDTELAKQIGKLTKLSLRT